jgi:hypothetical protein
MGTKATSTVAGHRVECTTSGVLIVDGRISVLPVGTHQALDELGQSVKRAIVKWWKEVR